MLPFDTDTPTEQVALDLLGAVLHRRTADGALLSGRIVETEAYLGLRDDACHSFHGKRTARVRSLYLPAGAAYVYRIYGIHLCLNVVTGDERRPEAVLIRALRPLAGQETMRRHRGAGIADARLCDGPGKLCQALGVEPGFDGHRLEQPPLWIEPAAEPVTTDQVVVTARVGLSARLVSYAWPLRFHLLGESHVSKARGLPEATWGQLEKRTGPVHLRP